MTNLHLQKLLYYAQAWYLADHDKSLFDEDFEAWVNGPVLPSQYYRFKKFDCRPILEEKLTPKIEELKVSDHLIKIVDVFGSENATSLEIMTHSELPWQEARKGAKRDEPSREKIKKSSMKSFYKNISVNS